MSPTSPALVSQDGVRRLARSVLLLVCAVYVLAGFVGRDAWRNDDVVAVAHMGEIAYGHTSWLRPTLAGLPTEHPGLLPYWLGAASLKLLAPAVVPDMAVRFPFMVMLVLALACTWYGTYYLARARAAQPVRFAFGGEAQPKDYARALADGGLLALIACLGLAKLGHESTPAVAQLACAAVLFLGYCLRPYRQAQGTVAAGVGVLGLTLCGAPELAIILSVGGALLEWRQARAVTEDDAPQRDGLGLLLILACTVASGLMAHAWGLWQSPGYPFSFAELRWEGYAQMLVWFMWPAWPISVWALWSWRRQLRDWSSNRHLAWPFYFVVTICLTSLRFDNADTTLLLALPPLAALAAFSLVTMNRQVSALMDWFAVLFFSVSGIIIWVVWVAMHTGVPAAPAANVARLLPAYVPRIVWWELALALAVSGAWAALVRWRSGRHRTAIWKTLVLPAGGATLCWLLLATLWMPLLDFAQSYKALSVQVQRSIPEGQCVQTLGLDRHEIAALRWYGQLKLASPWQLENCPWLLVQAVGDDNKTETPVDLTQWRLSAVVSHFVVYRDSVLVYQRR